MFLIDMHGKVIHKRIKLKISLPIEKRPMNKVRGIIVHQTGGTTAKSAFNSYNSGKSGTHRREMAKNVPNRYPSNQDSIGIEIVGQAFPVNEPDHDKRTYEALTKEQGDSLKWLIQELRFSLKVPLTEIFRHPTVSYKNKTEAATASW
ncbi:MAG: N-acetylmuramoyl-L-alanine amidase [Gammaproteobacteria bacterium]|nr:N-acetylmuramoyl-L-alanine amidase [Gammaproteobacteria bacterium]